MLEISGTSTNDLNQSAASIGLDNSRFSSDSEATFFEEDIESVLNLPGKGMNDMLVTFDRISKCDQHGHTC